VTSSNVYECAIARSENGLRILAQTCSSTSSEWFYPTAESGETNIRPNGTDQCVQAQSNGDVIQEDCTSNPDQEWDVYLSGDSGWMMFQNLAENTVNNLPCLEYSSSGLTRGFEAAMCNPSNRGQLIYPGDA
jgi:hypothetical protein